MVAKKNDHELEIKENNEKDENKGLKKEEEKINEQERIKPASEIKEYRQNNDKNSKDKKGKKNINASDIKPNTSRLSKQLDKIIN